MISQQLTVIFDFDLQETADHECLQVTKAA